MESVAIVRESLGRVEFGAVQRHANLTVFGLFGSAAAEGESAPHYLPLAEALEHDLVEIDEVSDAGSVPTLRARNLAEQPVFLLDGEELVGAKQNRVVNASMLLPPTSVVDIPVSCVEAGRWSRSTRGFRSGGRTQFARARARKAESVSYSLAAGQSFRSDQAAVWEDIDVKAERLMVDSPTAAMADIYQDRADELSGYRDAFSAQERQVGAVFAIGKTVLGAEVFGDRRLFAAYLPSIVEGYALDAIEEKGVTEAPAVADAEAIVAEISAVEFSEHPAVGLGEHLRIRARRLAGGALVHERAVVHVAGFRLDPEDPGPSRHRPVVVRGRR